jgi:hypothetical protein
MKRIVLILACGLHATLACAEWQDVKGEELRALYSDTTHRGTAEDQVCFAQMDGSGWCVTVQKDANRPGEYRSRRTTDGQLTNFTVTEK